jgi:hypothetical protein
MIKGFAMQPISREEGQKLIDQWKQAWKDLRTAANQDDSQDAASRVFWLSVRLGECGYQTNEDETDWYHPSDKN